MAASTLSFETTPKVICEQGGRRRLGELVASLSGTKVIVVTDPGLVKAGLVDPVLDGLRAAGIAVTTFSDVQADPPEASLQAAVELAISFGADAVIGFGGGSSMDTAKLVALLSCTPQSLPDIYGVGLANGPRLPLIQVPTTAGTGSEVTPISILTTPSSEKKGVVSALLYPDVALLDSQLTLSLPPAVTAMSGVDAMVHAIEAYTSRIKKNPISDALAVKALQLLFHNLTAVVTDGSDADVREKMLLGSLLAGMAFANAPVGAVHALAYPLGGHYHLPHGLTNSLVLSHVLEFNLPIAEQLYAQLGRAVLPALVGLDDRRAARGFVTAIEQKVRTMPYATSLREVGVKQEDLPMLATDAMKVTRLLANNARKVSYEDALAMYTAAY